MKRYLIFVLKTSPTRAKVCFVFFFYGPQARKAKEKHNEEKIKEKYIRKNETEKKRKKLN